MPKHDNRNIAVTFPGREQTKEQLQFLVVSPPQDHHQIPTENAVTLLEIRNFSFDQCNGQR